MTEIVTQMDVPLHLGDGAPRRQTLDDLIEELRRLPGTEQADIVLLLLETAQTLLPAARLGRPISEPELDDARECLRALSVSLRIHRWRQRG